MGVSCTPTRLIEDPMLLSSITNPRVGPVGVRDRGDRRA